MFLPLLFFARPSKGIPMRLVCVSKLACLLWAIGLFTTHALAQVAESFALPKSVADIFKSHCFDCHGNGSAEGDVQLDALTKLGKDERLDLLTKMQEQLYLNQMPPQGEPQPSDQAKQQLVSWITSQLAAVGQDAVFWQRMQSPKYGNYVDHKKLFSGEYKNLPGFTNDRDWLLSEFIFREKMNALLQSNPAAVIDGTKQKLRGNRLDSKIVNPFLLPKLSGVRYYANDKINSSHLLSMMGNAKHVANTMISDLSRNDPGYLPAAAAMTKLKFEHDAILESRRAYPDWCRCHDSQGSHPDVAGALGACDCCPGMLEVPPAHEPDWPRV